MPKLNRVFDKESDRRAALLNEINNYNETRDLDKLSLNLTAMLRTTEEREIIGKLKHFIPVDQQELFQTLTNAKFDQTPHSILDSNKRLRLKTMQQKFETNK